MSNADMPRQDNGQFAHALEAVCARCGQTKGIHGAYKPFAQDDEYLGALCDGFRKIRAKKPAR